MPDYSNSKIYKIIDNTNNNIYIGSTTQTLSKRLSKHVSSFKAWTNKTSANYLTSFKIIENGNYDIILIENVNCENKEQLHREERKHIELCDCVNKIHPTRTNKEYYNEHKEEHQERSKKYREENKEKIKEMKQKYQKDNKEWLNEISKQYREEHQEYFKDYKKEYYIKNKEAIKSRVNVNITCECGCISSKSNITRHRKSTLHIEKMKLHI